MQIYFGKLDYHSPRLLCLTYCWWKKFFTTWDVWNLVKSWINYQPQLVSRISSINGMFTFPRARESLRKNRSPYFPFKTVQERGSLLTEVAVTSESLGHFSFQTTCSRRLGTVTLSRGIPLKIPSKTFRFRNYTDLPRMVPGLLFFFKDTSNRYLLWCFPILGWQSPPGFPYFWGATGDSELQLQICHSYWGELKIFQVWMALARLFDHVAVHTP